MGKLITLTTDFGAADPYVGIMKGVILSLNPQATIIDLCHDIAPQNIAQAAFLLKTSYFYFPPETIHVVIVDPGVGGKRRAVILKTERAYFVAPDNGVLTGILEEAKSFQAFSIENPQFWLHPVSSTFHGRDIFAPVAAHLSLGVAVEEFGEPTSDLVRLLLPHPEVREGLIVGQVVHVDRFGNLITNIGGELLQGEFSLEIQGNYIKKLSTCYENGTGLLALIGSTGNLEIAVKNGSAAKKLRAGIGTPVRVRRFRDG